MARQVIWTQRGWKDLEETADYIARDSPRYSAALVRKVKAAARSLDHFSERGRVISEMNDPDFRQLLVGNYRLIYRVTPNTVYVAGLIHCARDLSSALESRHLP